MTNLGLWGPYVDESEMLGWYNLPQTLSSECSGFHPDGSELDPLSASEFNRLRSRTVSYANQSVAGYRPAYHNRTHFEQVEEAGLAAADAYAGQDPRKMPMLVRQALGLALYAHDAHHCASTFRVDARHGVYRPSLGSRVSTEWVTALAVNEFMQQRNLNLPTRLFQTSIIWASTYGGGTPRGHSLGIPDPRPRTVWGAIMRAADVCPRRTYQEQLRESIAVAYGEVPAGPAATTLNEFFEQQAGFMAYVEYCFNQLDSIALSTITTKLGWHSRLKGIRSGLANLKAGDRRLNGLLREETQRYGVTLS